MKKLERHGLIVESISDERSNGDGIWVYLKKKYADFANDPFYPTRQIHEQTMKGILSRIKNGVREVTDKDLLDHPHLSN